MKKFLLGTIVILFLLIFPFNKVFAASATLTWTEVTQNCDLSPANDIAGYVVKWGYNSGGPYPNEYIINGATTLTATVPLGTQDDVTVFFVVASYDLSGNRSDDPSGCGVSPEVSRMYDPLLPLPPATLN